MKAVRKPDHQGNMKPGHMRGTRTMKNMTESAETTTIKIGEASDCFLVLRVRSEFVWEGYQPHHPPPHGPFCYHCRDCIQRSLSMVQWNTCQLTASSSPPALPPPCPSTCIPHDGTIRVRMDQRLDLHPHPSIPRNSRFLLVLRTGKS